MEYSDRKAAFANGAKTYNTGKPCKNGHTTFRYTTSGTCAECITGTRALFVPVAKSPADTEQRQIMADVTANIMDQKFRVFHQDAIALMTMAEALCVARWPAAPTSMFRVKAAATGGAAGTAMYKVRIHPDDTLTMRRVAEALIAQHSRTSSQLAEMRQAAITRAAELVDLPDDEVYTRDPR